MYYPYAAIEANDSHLTEYQFASAPPPHTHTLLLQYNAALKQENHQICTHMLHIIGGQLKKK